MLEELPFRKAGEINKMVTGARERGATGMAGIAQLFTQLGLGEMGQSGSSATSAFNDLQRAKENQQQQQAQAGQAIGTMVALMAGL